MRLFVGIASYGTNNDQFLSRLIREYQSMRYSVDVVVFSNISKPVEGGVEVIVGLPGKNPRSLPFAHKQVFADRLHDYDLFIYSEDDILITENNIEAFLRVTSELRDDEITGFLRSETDRDGAEYFCDVHGPYHWDPTSVARRGNYTLAYFTNEHSACYLVTRRQLQRAIESRGFLVGPHEGKYDLQETAATDPYTQCGLKKFIPISHLDEFIVPHLPNKYIGRLGLDGRRFRMQIQTLLAVADYALAPYSLFESETKLHGIAYSKNYYEAVSQDVISAIPRDARTILSIGCGWGALEVCLATKGLRVVAVPVDMVIGSGMQELGVRIVGGDFQSVRRQLEGERFDCVLMTNVLQFVKNPAHTLASFAGLLGRDSVAVVVVPNLICLSNVKRSLLNVGWFKVFRGYEASAVHPTSSFMVRKWFRESGLKLDRMINVLSGRAETAARITLGAANPLLASEFIAVARRSDALGEAG